MRDSEGEGERERLQQDNFQELIRNALQVENSTNLSCLTVMDRQGREAERSCSEDGSFSYGPRASLGDLFQVASNGTF